MPPMSHRAKIRILCGNEQAVSTVEYALLLALIAAAAILGLRLIGVNIDNLFATIRAHL